MEAFTRTVRRPALFSAEISDCRFSSMTTTHCSCSASGRMVDQPLSADLQLRNAAGIDVPFRDDSIADDGGGAATADD